LTVIEEVRAATLSVPIGIIRNALAHFLFRGDDVFKPISVLSGGERSRVALAKYLIQSTNVLLLDEPTNHLDAATRESLLGALADYDGTIICASHDPAILGRIATVTYELDNADMKPLLISGSSDSRPKKGKKKHNLKGKKKKTTPAVS
jgi:ATP-binding cassette subfamily F protein 3